MNEQEAQQAQTIADEHWTLEQIIADAKEDDAFWESPEFDLSAVDSVRFYTQKRALLRLSHSQAQKIASMEENSRLLAGMFYDEKEALERQVAEQAKQIEKLKDRLRFEMQPSAKDGM